MVGDAVTFQGTAVDPDIPATELSFRWISDKDGDLGTGAINSSGEVLFSYSGLTADNHIITLAVEDEIGAVCQDTTLLIVGNPPTATIDAPTDGEIFLSVRQSYLEVQFQIHRISPMRFQCLEFRYRRRASNRLSNSQVFSIHPL